MTARLAVEDVAYLPKLNEKHQQILLATTTLDNPSYQNLSWHLDVPMGTVRSRLNRARAALANVKLTGDANPQGN